MVIDRMRCPHLRYSENGKEVFCSGQNWGKCTDDQCLVNKANNKDLPDFMYNRMNIKF